MPINLTGGIRRELLTKPLTSIRRFVLPSALTPMTKSGFALMFSVFLTSGLGLPFWAIAARLYDPEQLGLGAALISSMLALSSIAQLNLDNVINRFLPEAGPGSSKFILTAYSVSSVVAIIVAACYLVAAKRFVLALHSILTVPLVDVWFVCSVILWSAFSLEDVILASIQRAILVPLANTIYGVGKLLLLPLLATVTLSGLSLFMTWTLMLPCIVVGVNTLIFYRLSRAEMAFVNILEIRFITLMRRMSWDYVGRIATMLAIGMLPIFIVKLSGPAESAKYYLAWTIAYSIYLIGNAMARSMLAAAAADPQRLPTITRDAFVWAMIPVMAIVITVVLGSHWIMLLFGPAYTGSAATTLNVLALDSVLSSALAIYLGAARAVNRFRVVALVEVSNCVMVFLLSLLMLPDLGIVGVALAWLTSHTVIWTLVVAIGVGPRRRASTVAFIRAALGEPRDTT
jgi:O-antigen/teichoic acid export membrane protein